MKVAVLGGAGAMGGLFGARLAAAGVDVTLVDVRRDAVATLGRDGMTIVTPDGSAATVPVTATADPAALGAVDLVIVFVKSYHTVAAIRTAAALIGDGTIVLSLQNGWGNAARLADLVGPRRVLTGVTYHSATLLAPGRVLQAGTGPTFVGEVEGVVTARVEAAAALLRAAGFETTATPDVRREIWAKLCLNVCTLPAAALLGFRVGQLGEHPGTRDLMAALLQETLAVAWAKGIALDAEERRAAIAGVVERAKLAKGSMLQDIEHRRRTEIDVINGAVVREGEALGVPTPHNQALVWLVQSLEATFAPAGGAG